MQNEKLEVWKQQIMEFRFPRWNELPEIDLYMDQVVGYLNQKLAVFYDTDDEDAGKIITSTMINNYVKQKIISAPVKKRYDRACVSAMIMLFCVKQVLSIGMTGTLIAYCRRTEDPAGSYDRFCFVFEQVLRRTVSESEHREDTENLRRTDCMMTTTAIAFANKIYAGKLLSFCRQQDEDAHSDAEDGRDAENNDSVEQTH